MRPALRKPDGTKYFEYLLAYVDDLVGQSTDPDKMFGKIVQIFSRLRMEKGKSLNCILVRTFQNDIRPNKGPLGTLVSEIYQESY